MDAQQLLLQRKKPELSGAVWIILRTLEHPSCALTDIQDPEVQASVVNLLLNRLG